MWWFDLLICRTSYSVQEGGSRCQCAKTGSILHSPNHNTSTALLSTSRGNISFFKLSMTRFIDSEYHQISMQHRKRTGFGQHWVKSKAIFGCSLEWRDILNPHAQFKLLEDVVSSDKSELTAETTQRIVIVSYKSNIENQWLECPAQVNGEACS